MKAFPNHFLRLSTLFVLTLPLAHGDEPSSATLTEAVRDVGFRRGSDLDQILSAEPGLEIAGKDILTTGNRSRAELLFDNDILTRLGSNSIFSFSPDERVLELEEGLALIRVPKGSRQPVQMRTPAATAAITGTTCLFSVQRLEDDSAFSLKLAVLEGELEITYPDGQVLRMGAGQMIISSEDDQSPPDPVDIDIARLVRTSGIINDFERKLGSEALLQAAADRQERALRSGVLQPTGLSLNGRGTELDLEDDSDERFQEARGELFDDEKSADSPSPGDSNGSGGPGDSDDPRGPGATSLAGKLVLADSGDETGTYRFTAGEESYLSALFSSEGEDWQIADTQAVQFDAIAITNADLQVEDPLTRRFSFVAGPGEASPSFAIENLTAHGVDAGPLDGGESSALGFLDIGNGMDIGGSNRFTGFEGVVLGAIDGDIRSPGDIRIANAIGEGVYRGGTVSLFSENGGIQLDGEIDASGEGASHDAHGGAIIANAAGDIRVGGDGHLNASMTDATTLSDGVTENNDRETIFLQSRDGHVTVEGTAKAIGGSRGSIFGITSELGTTIVPDALIDVSTHPATPYKTSAAGEIILASRGPIAISGDLLANANPGMENASPAGTIQFDRQFSTGNEFTFVGARIEAKHGAGGKFLIPDTDPKDPVPDEEASGAGDVSMRETNIDVSGTAEFSPEDRPRIDVHGANLDLDQTNLTANAAGESNPHINLSAQNTLSIRNSSQLAALVNHGEFPGGRIDLAGGEEVRIEGTEDIRDTVLEAGTVAVTSRNIAVVDSHLRASPYGDIRLTGEESIDLLRAVLTAGNEISLHAPVVDVNDSSLTAERIQILRDNGNFDTLEQALAAGNEISGELVIRRYDGSLLDGTE